MKITWMLTEVKAWYWYIIKERVMKLQLDAVVSHLYHGLFVIRFEQIASCVIWWIEHMLTMSCNTEREITRTETKEESFRNVLFHTYRQTHWLWHTDHWIIKTRLHIGNNWLWATERRRENWGVVGVRLNAIAEHYVAVTYVWCGHQSNRAAIIHGCMVWETEQQCKREFGVRWARTHCGHNQTLTRYPHNIKFIKFKIVNHHVCFLESRTLWWMPLDFYNQTLTRYPHNTIIH